MSFENLKASAYALLEEISGMPSDRHVLHERLQEMIREMWAMGQTPPEDLVELEAWLTEDLSTENDGSHRKTMPETLRRIRGEAGGTARGGRGNRDRGRD